MSPKISMVIPIYNGEKYLPGTLDNILLQTMQDFEIICVDDCSTDASRDILKEYANKDNRISCIYHSKNMGQSQARKEGVLSSCGQYVMLMDQDDYLEPNAFEVACKAIEEKGTDLVQFETIVENCGDRDDCFLKKRLQSKEETFYGNLLNLCFVDIRKRKLEWLVWNKIYNGGLCRKACAAVEDGIIRGLEDYYFTFLILYYAESAANIKDNLYHYCYGRGITGNRKISTKQFTLLSKPLLVIDRVERFVAKQPESEQKDLTTSIEFIKRAAIDSTVRQFQRLLPDDCKIEELRAVCSSLNPTDTSFVITAFQEKLKRQRRELLNYSDISLARIDIKNQGADTNDVDIVEISDPVAEITEPEWICKNGCGRVLRTRAGSLDLKLKCRGTGELVIRLRGMNIKKPDGERWPLWIDYTKFVVDDKVMFNKVKPIWHDKPYRFATEVEDGKVVNVHIEWVADNVAIGPGKAQSCDMQEQVIKKAKVRAEELQHKLTESLPYKNIFNARMDIKNEGKDTNNVDIVEISDPDAKITEPKWACENGHGHMVKSTAGTLDMKLKCTGQGKLMITLRGMDIKKPDGERWPLWIDYTKFVVDDKVMFDKVKPIWHDKPYRFATEVEDGKVVNVHIEWVADNVAIGPGKAQSRDMQNQALKDAKAKTAMEHKRAVELNAKLKDAKAKTAMEHKRAVELNTKLKDANAANEKLERELADIRSGMSFRIGRAITYIPRKILGKK